MPKRITSAPVVLRKFALSLPEATEGTSCNNAAFKAGSKNFFFLGEKGGGFNAMLKLTETDSIKEAEQLERSQPDVFGVGKAGWVSCKFSPEDKAPVDVLERWILESYRALAPKKLVAKLD